MRAEIQSNLYVGAGKLLFCQPDQSLTILDLATGRVLVRDPDAECRGVFTRSASGILLSTHWDRIRMIDLPKTLARRRLTVSWQLRSGCRSALFVREFLVCARDADRFVELRSLSDGKVLWQYDARGEVNDLIEGKGRLLVQTGVYRLVHAVAVISLESGQELARRSIVQDAQFSVRGFDGDRIVLGARSPACTGTLLRVLRPDSTAGGLSSKDECEAPKDIPAAAMEQDCPPGNLCDL